MSDGSSDISLERLVDARERFLAFVKRHVVDPSAAEDILQTSLANAVEGLPRLRDKDRAVPWFYSILKNAITDWYRQRAQSRIAALPPELDIEEEEQAVERRLCRCFEPLLSGLHPQYAQMIELLDLQNQPTAVVAERLGITPGNLKVRHHRARQALRRALEDTCRVCAEHHCMDCTCSEENSLERRSTL
jgi:RNA polymerase sigma-70 factor, ECF subfamily